MAPPRTGEITQLAAIAAMVGQLTAASPVAAMPDPMTPPTMAWVVETGAPIQVARLSHRAAASRAASMAVMKMPISAIGVGSMIPLAMVETTSPPAITAPAVLPTAAMSRAPNMVMAREPTAGPMLLATSLAPMFSAM